MDRRPCIALQRGRRRSYLIDVVGNTRTPTTSSANCGVSWDD